MDNSYQVPLPFAIQEPSLRSRPALVTLGVLCLLLTGCPPATPPTGKTPSRKSPKTKTGDKAPIGSSSKPQDLGPPPPQEIEAVEVKVGEHYRFLTHQGELTIKETWQVTAVTAGKEVRYDLHSVTEVKGAEPLTTGPTPKILRLSIDEAPAPPGPPPVADGEETIEVDGIAFKCTIYQQGRTRRWISGRFPRLIKLEQEGKPFRLLIGVDAPE